MAGRTSKKDTYAGAVRIAMRDGRADLHWLLGDHLGSTSVVLNSNGSFNGGQGYMPWGEARYGMLPTGYAYTGQYDEDYIELYWYNSRWYDPALGSGIELGSKI